MALRSDKSGLGRFAGRSGPDDPAPRQPPTGSAGPADDPGKGRGRHRRRWVEELGDVSRAPTENRSDPSPDSGRGGPSPTARPDAVGGLWEVDRLPSEAEGGIVSLLLNDPQRTRPGGPPPIGPIGHHPGAPTAPPATMTGASAPRLGSLPPAWSLEAAAGPGTGLARLSEMLEHLPEGSVPRLTPDDVDVEAPQMAPPAVWFWGDDDIYPGRLPGSQQRGPRPGPARATRKGLSRARH